MTFRFQVNATDGYARAGMLSMAHGQIETPAFMPVATQGSVKAIAPDDLKSLGATILLSNTYQRIPAQEIALVRITSCSGPAYRLFVIWEAFMPSWVGQALS